eukprot:m.198074 g.198074  ORF g.198074 m.198074 type:complete len:447 (-) comp18732_c0_seq2:328-1668(-)
MQVLMLRQRASWIYRVPRARNYVCAPSLIVKPQPSSTAWFSRRQAHRHLQNLSSMSASTPVDSAASVIGMQRLKTVPFELERYFAKYEFTAKYLLCCSDCEAASLKDILALADDECKALWDNMTLGYSEAMGIPQLRKDVAMMYESDAVSSDGVLIGAPQELILLGLTGMLEAGDHVIVTWPGYQSLYECARMMGADVSYIDVSAPGFDICTAVAELIRPNTKALILNLPHNPTGFLPTHAEFDKVLRIARDNKLMLFSDEMYRGLEFDSNDTLPAACTVYDKAITLSGLSKSLSMPGARVGWLATQDTALLERIAALKDYTTICTANPSEILGCIAIRNRQTLVANNLTLLRKNLELLDAFFARHTDLFSWTRPKAGSMCFPRLLRGSSDDFCKDLVEKSGCLLLPGSVYGHNGNHFRVGFGRRDMEKCLGVLEQYIDAHMATSK